jgi:hypothetical protein
MDEPTTRPGAFGRAEAQRIARETAAALREMSVNVDNDREYREHVLTTLARMEVKQDNLQIAFVDHVKEDEVRFGSVTQKIGSNTDWINKGIGMLLLFTAMMGLIMWLVDKVKP